MLENRLEGGEVLSVRAPHRWCHHQAGKAGEAGRLPAIAQSHSSSIAVE